MFGIRRTYGVATESHWSDLNRRPLDYESSALPLSYSGNIIEHALARIRTATPFGTTPSRWRVYQFHHQGAELRELGGSHVRGFAVANLRISQLANHRKRGRRGSNPRPLE